MQKLLFTIFLLVPLGYGYGQETLSTSYFKAEQLFLKQSYNEALLISNSIPTHDSYYVNALILSGHIFLHLDLPDSSENKFFDVLKIDHRNSSAYNGLGLVYYKRINTSKRIVQLFKNLFIESNEKKSEKMFLRALKYNENYADARYNLARLYLKSQDETKRIMAENFLTFLVREYPGNEFYIFSLGEVKRLLKKNNEAISYFNQIIFGNPNNADACLQLSYIYFKQKKYKEFTENYYNAIKQLTNEELQVQLIRETWDILTDTERKVVKLGNLPPDFFYKLWRKKDPNPITKINERLIIHYKRLKLVRELYKADTFSGYDDRGKIYVQYGEPQQIYQNAMPDYNVKGNESWLYKISGKRITFDFVEHGAEYNLVNDLSEAVNINASGYSALKILIDLYQKRIHLDQSYERILIELNSIPVEQTKRADQYIHVLNRFNTEKMRLREEIPISTYKYTLEGHDFPFEFNYAYFYEKKGKIRLEFYFAIDIESLKVDKRNNNSSWEIDQNIFIQTNEYEPLINGQNYLKIDKKKFAYGKFITQTNIFTDESSLICSIQMAYKRLNQKRLVTFPINVPQYNPNTLNVSSIQISSLISPAIPGDQNIFKKHNLTVTPNPSTTINKDSTLFLYFELYDLTMNETGLAKYQINLKVINEENFTNFTSLLKKINPFSNDKKKSIVTNMVKNSHNKTAFEYFGLDLSALSNGRYKLLITIIDLNSDQIVNRSVKLNLTN